MEYGGINISNHFRQFYVFCGGGAYLPFPKSEYLTYQADKTHDETAKNESEQMTWRIDGAAFGVRFYARYVGSARGMPPALISVRIPDQMRWPAVLWAPLDARDSVHMSRTDVVNLGISQHILMSLTSWSNQLDDFDRYFAGLPFASRIEIDEIRPDPSSMRPEIVPNNDLPKYLWTLDQLKKTWNLDDDLPPAIHFRSLVLERQLTACISLVKLPAKYGRKIMAFKADGMGISIIYHELKNLLTMPRMENVIEPPEYLVTTDDDKVVGFLLKNYKLGDFEHLLPTRRRNDTLQLPQQIRWARDLTAAFLHIRTRTNQRFYSDLRMDNLLLWIDDNGDERAVLADFQQNRGLYNWSPPEVYLPEFLAELGIDDFMRTEGLPEDIMDRYEGLINKYLKSRNFPKLPLRGMPLQYDNSTHGWFFPWTSSSSEEQEAGMVFMLGKALWCILEGRSEVDRVLGRSTPFEDDDPLRFPNFIRTPPEMQDLIKRCTRGAREWCEGLGQDGPIEIFRLRGKIFPLGKTGVNGQAVGTYEETEEAIRSFWQREILKAEMFIDTRMRFDNGEDVGDDKGWLSYLNRPSLLEVQQALEIFAASL